MAITSCVILLPINVTSNGDQKGLNVLSLSNIPKEQNNKLLAHLIFTILYTGKKYSKI